MSAGAAAAASEAVAEILSDMLGRRGFRQNWDGIDEDVRHEIINAWTTAIAPLFDEAIAAEREACATTVEDLPEQVARAGGSPFDRLERKVIQMAAAAIRARKS